MFETYRMLGEERERELLREARRLHAGRATKDHPDMHKPRRRVVSIVRRSPVAMLFSRRWSPTTPRFQADTSRSRLDP
jgi:hypothetical protein